MTHVCPASLILVMVLVTLTPKTRFSHSHSTGLLGIDISLISYILVLGSFNPLRFWAAISHKNESFGIIHGKMGQPSETPNTKKLEIRSLLAPKEFFNEIFNVFNLNQLLWSPMTSRLLVRFLAPTFPPPTKNVAKIFTNVNTHPQKPMEPVSFCIIHWR